MRGLFLAAAIIAASCHAAPVDTSGTITILEGDALIYRGMGRLHAAEGVRLVAGDIVETAPATFMQLELPDQTVAQFGAGTRVMLGAAARGKSDRWLYLLEGWAKLSGMKRDGAKGPGVELRSAMVDIPPNTGVVVLRSTPAELNLFAERGEVRVSERQASGAPTVIVLKGGDFYRRKAGTRGAVNPGSMQGFVDDMPRFFRDSLPLRAERFKDQAVRPKEAPEFAYADVERWLKSEPAVRKPLMQRWRAKARETAFRSALIANLSSHPEWDPILFPEKYLPKETAARPHTVASAPRP
jgi:hypothetical protein